MSNRTACEVIIGGVPITALSRQEWVERLVTDWRANAGRAAYPRFMTSANGHVLALYARDRTFRDLLDRADGIDADGMPLVLASRWLATPLPERVATTDFFHDAAKAASDHGMRFFLLGATPAENAAALARVRLLYPALQVTGHHGYFEPAQEHRIVDMILSTRTDVLWVGCGVPREQEFVVRNLSRLRGVTWVKTCGGLLNFLSGTNARAPQWMQESGLEWAYRVLLEPRRLFWRYATTNAVALYLMATRSSASAVERPAIAERP